MEKTAEGEMSKEPKIEHEYHAHKDKMTITIHGYSLSKKVRDAIMKKLIDAVERSPDGLIADSKENAKKVPAKSFPVTKRHPNCLRRLATESERRNEQTRSLIPRQLPASPMLFRARRIKHPLDVTVQGSHDADPREHRRAAMFCNQQKRLHRGLPFFGIVFSLGQLGDVVASVLQRDELASARQRDRFIERRFPALG
jgi:hypothetical protein